MGTALEIVLDDPIDLEPFICSICQDLYHEPVHLGCPDDHVFCASCLAEHIKSTSNVARTVLCPLCRARVRADHSRPGLFVRRQLDRLRVKCKAADCTWTGRLGDGHDLQCEKQITTCVHQHVGSGDPCGWRGPIPSLGEHDLVCPFKPVVCPREGCTAALSRKDLDIHESTCTYFRCSFFARDGCPFRGRHDEREIHQTYCTRLHVRLGRQEATFSEEKRLRLLAEERVAQLQAQVESMVQQLASEELEDDSHSQVTIGDDDPEIGMTEDTAHLPSALPTSDSPTSRPSSPTTSTRESSPHRSSSAPPAPPPFQLTTSRPVRPASPRLPPLSAPSGPTRPFDLTSAALTTTHHRPDNVSPLIPRTAVPGPFSLTRKLAVAGSTSARTPKLARPRAPRAAPSALDDVVGDEGDDPGRWEKGGTKRPRFDGGFPREWAPDAEESR